MGDYSTETRFSLRQARNPFCLIQRLRRFTAAFDKNHFANLSPRACCSKILSQKRPVELRQFIQPAVVQLLRVPQVNVCVNKPVHKSISADFPVADFRAATDVHNVTGDKSCLV